MSHLNIPPDVEEALSRALAISPKDVADRLKATFAEVLGTPTSDLLASNVPIPVDNIYDLPLHVAEISGHNAWRKQYPHLPTPSGHHILSPEDYDWIRNHPAGFTKVSRDRFFTKSAHEALANKGFTHILLPSGIGPFDDMRSVCANIDAKVCDLLEQTTDYYDASGWAIRFYETLKRPMKPLEPFGWKYELMRVYSLKNLPYGLYERLPNTMSSWAEAISQDMAHFFEHGRLPYSLRRLLDKD